MILSHRLVPTAFGCLFVLSSPVAAQQAQQQRSAGAPRTNAAAEAMDDEEATIVVNGQKPPGSVVGDIPPEQVLNPADVRAYGVNSISDLLDQLSPQTTSNRGRGGEAPAVLLNGKRISSFAEIRDIPTEAILRVEVLPEEVALKYGFSADQKVVNFVLRRRFTGKTVVADAGTSTDGGGTSGTLEGGTIRIRGDNRFNLNGRVQASQRLLESDRNLTSTVAGTDVSPYRTLSPETETLTLNSVYARAFGDVSATANAMLTVNRSKSLNGLPTAILAVPGSSPFAADGVVSHILGNDPLSQRTSGWTGHLGGGANGQFSSAWRWTATGNYDHGDSRTRAEAGFDLTDLRARIAAGDPTLDPLGSLESALGDPITNRARSITNSGDFQLITRGNVFKLPAGDVGTTIRIGGTRQTIDASSLRFGVTQDAALRRTGGNGQLSIDVPIANSRTGTLSILGKLTANANIAVNQLSDIGTLRTYGYGINWTPRPPLTLIVSVTGDEGAPTIAQLGNPVVVTPGTRVFDYRRGQSVDVTAITGGNPALSADNRHVLKIGGTWKPLPKVDLTFTANYVKSRIRDAINALPEPTAAIEAAFPDRFTRDDDGNLTRIDTRPVNFDREDQESLRWGFNLSLPLKPTKSQIAAFRKLAAERGFAFPAGPRDSAGGPPPPPDGGPPPPNGTGDRPPATGPDGSRPPSAAGADGTRPPGGGFGPGGGGRGGGFGGFRGGGQGRPGGRIQVAVYHTWHFVDQVLIRPGLPVLDRLNGDATGSGGGQPRHEIEGQLGYFNAGLGVRLSANYQSPTTANAAAGSTAGDLRFSSLTTFDLRVFADLGQMPAFIGKDWARNLRVTFAVTNLFNQRQDVRDANGDTPVRYQPAYLDPLGRTVRISLRKLFAPLPPRGVFRQRS